MPTAAIWSLIAGLILLGLSCTFTYYMAKRPTRTEQAESEARTRAMQDAILGEPEVRDLGGGIIQAKRLGLVDRTSTLEATVAQLADQSARIQNLDTRVTALESDKVERIVTRAEAAAMWQAVANRDDIEETP